jgi:hypothetical protein
MLPYFAANSSFSSVLRIRKMRIRLMVMVMWMAATINSFTSTLCEISRNSELIAINCGDDQSSA